MGTSWKGFKTFWIAAVILASFSTGPAMGATPTISLDGYWWKKLSVVEKVRSVQGLIEGYQSGWVDGWGSRSIPDKSYALQVAKDPKLKDFYANVFNKGFPVFSNPFGVYVDEITDFYLMHPKRKKTNVGSVMGCLYDQSDTQSCLKFVGRSSKK